ncbi:hypothetical protein HDV05_005862 [Chytridiales sp. JEL 0842]|nr:hypothetical protein HDV05_005862 [Chytridiales sp. JEL 0842]
MRSRIVVGLPPDLQPTHKRRIQFLTEKTPILPRPEEKDGLSDNPMLVELDDEAEDRRRRRREERIRMMMEEEEREERRRNRASVSAAGGRMSVAGGRMSVSGGGVSGRASVVGGELGAESLGRASRMSVSPNTRPVQAETPAPPPTLKPKKFTYRPRTTGTKSSDSFNIAGLEATYPVQPWATVKNLLWIEIQGKLPVPARQMSMSTATQDPRIAQKRASIAPPSSAVGGGTNLLLLGGNLGSSSNSLQSTQQQGPILLPYGPQLQRSFTHPPSSCPLKSVIFIPSLSATSNTSSHASNAPSNTLSKGSGSGGETFATMDAQNIHVWKGGLRIRNVSTSGKARYQGLSKRRIEGSSAGTEGGEGDGGESNRNTGVVESKEVHEALRGADRWVFIEKYRVWVVYSKQFKLKLLDSHFVELCSISCPRPILSMEFIPSKNDLLVGEVGSIRIWKIKREIKVHQETYHITEHLCLSDFKAHEWIKNIRYERILDRIIASIETSIYMYDYNTGQPLDSLKNIHTQSITSYVFHEPTEYLITASECGRIKVWNSQHFLLNEFHDHHAPVTCLLLLEGPLPGGGASPTLVLSGSMDGTVRIWDFELGNCLTRLDVGVGVRGLGLLKRDVGFFLYSADTVQVWSFNKVHEVFSYTRVRSFAMKRWERELGELPTDSFGGLNEIVLDFDEQKKSRAPRLVVAFEDGSVRLLSPVTGKIISTGFPIYKDASLVDFFYDTEQDLIYCQLTNGDIVVYDAGSNPMKIIEVWDNCLTTEKINCITAVDLSGTAGLEYMESHDERLKRRRGFRKKFYMVGGSLEGQIMYMDTAARGDSVSVIQAHTSEITALKYDHINMYLVSGARDMLIKVWKLSASSSGKTCTDPDITPLGRESIMNCPLAAQCVAVLTLPESGPWNILLDKTMTLNPQQMTLALPCNGGIVLNSYECNDPIVFDPHVDFWGYCYEEQKQLYQGPIRWHVPKENRITRVQAPLDTVWKRVDPIDWEEVAKRRARRLFLAQEAEAYKKARIFDAAHAMSSYNAAHARDVKDQPPVSDSDDVDDNSFLLEKGDIGIIQRVNSEVALLPVGVIRPQSPSDMMLKGTTAKEHRKKTPLLRPPVRKMSTAKKEAKMRQAVEAKQVLKAPAQVYRQTTQEEIEKRRERMKKRLLQSGFSLPNSTVKKEVKQEVAAVPQLFPKPKFKPDPPKMIKEPVKFFSGQVVKFVEEPIRSPSAAELNNEESDHVPTETTPSPAPPKNIVIPVRDYDINRRESSTVEVAAYTESFGEAKVTVPITVVEEDRDDGPEIVVDEVEEVVFEVSSANDLEEGTQKVEETKKPSRPMYLTPTPRKQPMPKRTKKRTELVQHTPAKYSIPSSPTSKIFDDLDLSELEDNAQLLLNSRPHPAILAPETHTPLAKSNTDADHLVIESEKRPSWSAPNVSSQRSSRTFDCSMKLRNYSTIAQTEAERYAWDLLKQKDASGLPEELQRIAKLFWFPKIEERPITLASYIRALLNLIKIGLWSESCEASKALLFIYRTFKHDFPDPLSLLIRPQLDAMAHSVYWQVRAQLTVNVAAYGIRHDEVMFGLISRLTDKNEIVREAAKVALKEWGIVSKATLKNVMINIRMLPYDGPSYEWTTLDEYMEDIKEREAAVAAESAFLVHEWIDKKLPPRAERSYTAKRQNSYFEHLAGQFFPPDGRRDSVRPRSSSPNATRKSTNSHKEAEASEDAPIFDKGHLDHYIVSSPALSTFDGISEGWDTRSMRSKASISFASGKLISRRPSQRPKTAPPTRACVTRAERTSVLTVVSEVSCEVSTTSSAGQSTTQTPNPKITTLTSLVRPMTAVKRALNAMSAARPSSGMSNGRAKSAVVGTPVIGIPLKRPSTAHPTLSTTARLIRVPA